MGGPATLGQRYLASVYRDARLLHMPEDQVSRALANLTWIYHSGQPLFCIRCVVAFADFSNEMLSRSDRSGATHIALLYKSPNLIHVMALFGFLLHSRVPGPQPLAAAAHSWDGWASDHAWVEVVRLRPTWIVGEGGAFGYWFEVAAGSGVALNVGRSLRAHNRSHLASLLGLNVTDVFARPARGDSHVWKQPKFRHNRSAWTADPQLQAQYANVSIDDEAGLRRRYFDIYPWRLETMVDLCKPARARGFDTLQIWAEMCSMDRTQAACGIEIVSCHASVLRLPSRQHRATCPPGLPLRTGWDHSLECRCNETFSMLNCADTRESEVPPIPLQIRPPSADIVRQATQPGGHSWWWSWRGAVRMWPPRMQLCGRASLTDAQGTEATQSCT